jgi:hypothetical protein
MCASAHTATVTGQGKTTAGPTGTINFVDSTAGNAVLATASLGSSSTLPLGYVASPVTGGEPSTIVAGDFNQDGNLDLAVGPSPYSPSISVLLGDGSGNFTATESSPITTTGIPVLVQDFNQDGYPDSLLSDELTGQLTILLGNGDGTFRVAPGSPFYTNYGTSPVAVADFR